MKRFIKLLIIKSRQKSKKVKIANSSSISLNTNFEGGNIIGENSSIIASNIKKGTYIGSDCSIMYTEIGKYCSIANGVKTIISTHPTEKYVSTHPSFFSLRKQSGFTYVNRQKYEEVEYVNKSKKISVQIGNDVWIGEDVKILGGIKIGDGAIIGAGAIVTKDVLPYSINVGIPAKPIKYRFNDKQIDFLEKFKWWDKDEEWLRNNYELFDNIDLFMEKFNDK